ncbi:MAG: hypothetical protein ABSG10_01760 [Terracidiphilus sp.]|jgi:hypothetical protein
MRLASVLPPAALSIATTAHATDAQAVLTPLRNHFEASDYRAAGQLARVDANGKRSSYALSAKGLWFAGALHMLVGIVPPRGAVAAARQDECVHFRGSAKTHLSARDSGSEQITHFEDRP